MMGIVDKAVSAPKRRRTVRDGTDDSAHVGAATCETKPLRSAWFRPAAAGLWPAWKGLERWEETAADELSEPLGELIVLLWTVHRFGAASIGTALLDFVVDEELHPTIYDPVLDDIVEMAFALGAAWAAERTHALQAERRPALLLHR